ncbi:MAG TPA: TfoX/Sxy family protein [Pseudomonadota bacterium]|jgi:DNA transformation protein|nr:TfoX/Sxy family protein [Pseudomonadota bacterium]
MPISPGLLEQIAAQLAALPELAIRRMFGGAGLYSSGVFFGVVDDDRVYLRIGDGNRDDFKRAGSVAFQPIPDKPAMAYFSVPTMVIARSERFVEWAKKAVDAARAAKAAKPKRAKTAPAKKVASRTKPAKKAAATPKRTAAPARKAAAVRKKAAPAKKAGAKRRR